MAVWLITQKTKDIWAYNMLTTDDVEHANCAHFFPCDWGPPALAPRSTGTEPVSTLATEKDGKWKGRLVALVFQTPCKGGV